MEAIRALQERPLVVLNGRAGSGKTQVVAAFVRAALRVFEPIPVFKDQKDETSNPSDRGRQNGSGGVDSTQTTPTKPGQQPSRQESKVKYRPQVLLTAPTGKAASVLEKRIGDDQVSAATLHAVMHSLVRNNPMYKSTKVWVVDECSMVPITVFRRVRRWRVVGESS
jgi:ATP-dependent exoDNAse (exonuclease V) alpha subunit